MDNMFLETPIHALDAIRAIAEAEVQEVHSVVKRTISDYKDVHAALILFDNGCVAQHIANYTTNARLDATRFTAETSPPILKVSLTARFSATVANTKSPTQATVVPLNRIGISWIVSNPIRLFRSPAANLDEAVKTMELCEAILSGLR